MARQTTKTNADKVAEAEATAVKEKNEADIADATAEQERKEAVAAEAAAEAARVKAAEDAAEAENREEAGTIRVQLITPYPQVMPVTGIRFLPNDSVIVPNNAWVKARIKDEMLVEVE